MPGTVVCAGAVGAIRLLGNSSHPEKPQCCSARCAGLWPSVACGRRLRACTLQSMCRVCGHTLIVRLRHPRRPRRRRRTARACRSTLRSHSRRCPALRQRRVRVRPCRRAAQSTIVPTACTSARRATTRSSRSRRRWASRLRMRAAALWASKRPAALGTKPATARRSVCSSASVRIAASGPSTRSRCCGTALGRAARPFSAR